MGPWRRGYSSAHTRMRLCSFLDLPAKDTAMWTRTISTSRSRPAGPRKTSSGCFQGSDGGGAGGDASWQRRRGWKRRRRSGEAEAGWQKTAGGRNRKKRKSLDRKRHHRKRRGCYGPDWRELQEKTRRKHIVNTPQLQRLDPEVVKVEKT